MSSAEVAPVLRIVAGSKVYGGIHAIDSVDFDLRPGEIHAVLGENGAGKSTLCKAISGAIKLTSGDYILGGTQVSFSSPGEALKNGVAMVYQETSLVPSMTVAQNLELGMEKFFTVYRKINIAAQQSQQALNFNVDPLALVETLGTAKRQMVEIARAVRHNARVIIFDEPTASLTPEEMQHLFHLLNSLRSQRRRNHLHFACARRGAQDRRSHHRPARRQACSYRSGGRARPASYRADDGWP